MESGLLKNKEIGLWMWITRIVYFNECCICTAISCQVQVVGLGGLFGFEDCVAPEIVRKKDRFRIFWTRLKCNNTQLVFHCEFRLGQSYISFLPNCICSNQYLLTEYSCSPFQLLKVRKEYNCCRSERA